MDAIRIIANLLAVAFLALSFLPGRPAVQAQMGPSGPAVNFPTASGGASGNPTPHGRLRAAVVREGNSKEKAGAADRAPRAARAEPFTPAASGGALRLFPVNFPTASGGASGNPTPYGRLRAAVVREGNSKEKAGAADRAPRAARAEPFTPAASGGALRLFPVDGLSPTPSWTSTGQGGYFGYSVATAGDVDGDGYADLLVGASDWGGSLGRVYLYRGTAAGPETSPTWIATGETSGDEFGIAVAAAGDVNGDGYADVLVGARGPSGYRGKAYLYLGSADGLSPTPAWTALGEDMQSYFGLAVASAGDVNGDGYADVLVGAPGGAPGMPLPGSAYLYLGSATGLAPTPAWIASGENDDDRFGISLASAGDVDGDGYADVVVGALAYSGWRGKAYLYRGSAAGLETVPAWTAMGENGGDRFGVSVATAGDVNGDGYADVLVGACGSSESYPGWAYLFSGSAAGLSLTPVWTAAGENNGDAFGRPVAPAGDVDGDGYADVLVGAGGYPAYTLQGRAYLYRGSPAGLETTPAWTATGEASDDYFGMSLAPAGDANGDGYADVVVGAFGYGGGGGKAYLYQGAADTPSAAPGWNPMGENDGDRFGGAVATAGDVNGDGYADVLVGANTYPGGAGRGIVSIYMGSAAGLATTPAFTTTGETEGDRFGSSLAAAGDVNGDGYGDVVVGAFGYAGSRGKAYLYLGSPAGLSPTPAWTATGEAEVDRFGGVAAAGDVDGDGYGDVLVGADGWPEGQFQGKAYLFMGSAAGLSPTPTWTASGGAGDRFGIPVATAGDVNGDGYADVFVGAPGYPEGNFRGRAYLYAGSAAGLSLAPVWTATGENDFDFFSGGATAGDVNGDGYADVVVGASGVYTTTGKVYLFLGTAAGLSTTPAWTAIGENEGDWFGASVQTAGDVNGDGYADLFAGAYGYPLWAQRGKVYLFLGATAGPGTAPAWAATGEADGDYFGMAIGPAGDVDGDGYADLLVGAFGSPGGAQRGQAYLYPGNGGGRVVLARAARGDGSGLPVPPWGLTHAPDSFQAHAWATDPMGRGRVKLEIQACPPGVPFTSTACLTYTAATWTDVTTATSGVTLGGGISGLETGTLYRWRARVLYAPQHVVEPGIVPPPHPAHGPWRRFSGQAQEADLRTGPCAGSVAVTPAGAARAGDPGADVVYTLYVTNTGACSDTFPIVVDARWPTAAPAAIGPLAPGAGAALAVTVTVPLSATCGSQDDAAVTLFGPILSATSILTTTANAVYGIVVAPLTAAATGAPGAQVPYTLRVTNTANCADTFTITVSGNAWTTTAPAALGPLDPAQGIAVPVVVDIPGGASGGDQDVATLTIASQGDPTLDRSSVLTTTVEGTTWRIFLPVILRFW